MRHLGRSAAQQSCARLALALIALLFLRGDMYPDASNAKLPEARQNLTYTPPSCDGVVVPNAAAMTLGSPALTLTGGALTQADQGKLITVAGAGPTQSLQAVTIQSGGTGYTPGDVITLAGGAGSSAKIVVASTNAGIVTAADVWTPYGSGGKYTAVPANPIAQGSITTSGSGGGTGTGTGLTVNATWRNDNLVTTIQSVADATTATLAANAAQTVSGVTAGYGSDYSSQIQAAVATPDGATLPVGICGHASTIQLTNPQQKLQGQGGTGALGQVRTTLLWLGPAGGTQVQLGDGTRDIYGLQFGGLQLEGACGAARGVTITNVRGSEYPSTTVRRHTQIGVSLDAPLIGGGAGDNSNFYNWGIRQGNVDTCDDYTAGLTWGPGASNADVFGTHWYGGNIQVKNAPGIRCGNSDTNNIDRMLIQIGGAAGPSLEAQGSNIAAHGCRDNKFDITPPNGVVVSRGTPSGFASPAQHNKIDVNLALTPVTITTEDGAQFWGQSNVGRFLGSSKPAFFNDTGYAPTGGNLAGKMMGLASGLMGASASIITPTRSGIIVFTVTGRLTQSVNNAGALVKIKYGTGPPPINGAAETGVMTGPCTSNIAADVIPTGQSFPFTAHCVAGGFQLDVPVWFDLLAQAVTGGVATPTILTATAVEQ